MSNPQIAGTHPAHFRQLTHAAWLYQLLHRDEVTHELPAIIIKGKRTRIWGTDLKHTLPKYYDPAHCDRAIYVDMDDDEALALGFDGGFYSIVAAMIAGDIQFINPYDGVISYADCYTNPALAEGLIQPWLYNALKVNEVTHELEYITMYGEKFRVLISRPKYCIPGLGYTVLEVESFIYSDEVYYNCNMDFDSLIRLASIGELKLYTKDDTLIPAPMDAATYRPLTLKP